MDLQQYLQAIFADHRQNEYKRIGWQVAAGLIKPGLYKSYIEKNKSFKNIEDCKKHIEELSLDPTVISIWITPNSFSIPSHAEDLLSSIDWMFVDIDYTDIGKIQSKINLFNLYPTMIVNSGKGLQIYWKLTDEWTSEEWKKAQSGIQTHFNADNMVSRAGSYLRVPGTFNRKHLLEKKRDEGYADAYQCEILEINNNEYTQDDFPGLTDQQHQEPDMLSSTSTSNLPGMTGLNKIRQNCQVVDDAFNSIEDNDANNKPGHLKRLLAASMSKHTLNDEQYVLDLFSNCDDFNADLTLKQYRSINQNPITCKKLQSSEWDYACKKTCPLMQNINKKSPIAFAYRQGNQLELTEDLLRNTDSDSAFEEVVRRIKSTDNLLRRSKLIRQASAAYGIRETEIKQYLRDVIVNDERLPFILNGKVDEVKAAEFIIRKYNIIRYLEEFYQYRDGIWKRLPQEETEALIHKEIREYSSNHVVSEVLCAVKRESLVTPNEVENIRNKFVIACNNGLLDVQTKCLTSFKPEDYRFQKMNANYDTNAKSPGFLKVVNELFKGDSDANDKKMLLQEYMGYLLIPDYTLVKKMLYMWGPKANNGKSTVIDIIYALMGEAYIDSIPLNKLDGFMLNRLVGKHANIVADQDASTKVPDGVFKQLVGGRDRITADVKYKDAINFKNTARLIFAVNKLPYSQAKDSGYYTRIVTLVFNNEFVVNPGPHQMQADPEKIDTIIEQELDGILNWALEGLDRLLVNRKLTIPPSSVDALQEYQAENNSVILFANEECIIDKKRRIARTTLYRMYKTWCEESGFVNKVNANTFFKTLESNYGIKQVKLNGVRQFKGIWHA